MRQVSVEDFSSEDYRHNPFPIWRQMRDEQPLFYDSVDKRWILTRYEDVMSVLHNHTTYSTRTYVERFQPIFGRTLAELDGARHIRERTIVAPAFVGKSLIGYEQFITRSIERISE